MEKFVAMRFGPAIRKIQGLQLSEQDEMGMAYNLALRRPSEGNSIAEELN